MFKFSRLLAVLSILVFMAQFADARKTQPAHRYAATEKTDFVNEKGNPHAEGWTADYIYQANYSDHDPTLNAKVTPKLRNNTGGYLLEAKNPNRGDASVFMFINKEIDRLMPNVEYQIELHNILIASNKIDYSAPNECMGFNNTIGANSYVKIGATTFKPKVVSEKLGDETGSHVRYFDEFPDGSHFSYGSHSSVPGEHTRVLGNIGYRVSGGDCFAKFESKSFPLPKPANIETASSDVSIMPVEKKLTVRTDNKGRFSLILGIHTTQIVEVAKLPVYIKNIELSIFPIGGSVGGI